MNKRKLLPVILMCLLVIWQAHPLLAAEEQAPLTLRVYLFDPCGGCASSDTGCRECEVETAVLYRLMARFKAELDAGRLQIRMRNLLYEPVQKEHQGYLRAFDALDTPRSQSPTYVLGEPGWGAILFGEDQEPLLLEAARTVMARMPSDAAWRREPGEGQDFVHPRSDPLDDIQDTDSLILYFFKDFCPYCKDLEVLFEALPEYVYLEDGSKSRLRFVSLEKQIPAQMQVVQRYYDTLFVHPDRQFVPMVVIGNQALFLREEIVRGLLPALLAGEGLKTNRRPLASLAP